MLVKGNDVLGLKVLSIREGKEEGTVKDIIYDPSQNKMRALLIDEGGLFSDAKVILTQDIKSIGKDAVTIGSENDIKKASQVAQPIATIAKGSQYLTNTKIVTEDGTDLGKVSDIYFDPVTGNVEEFEVSQGALKQIGSGVRTFKVNDIMTIGKDVTVVKGYTEKKLEAQGRERGISGTFNRAVETVKQKAPEVAEQAKTKASDLSQSAQQKAQEVKESPQAKEAQQTVGQKAEEAKQKAQQTAQGAQQKAQEVKESPEAQKAKEKIEQVPQKAEKKTRKATHAAKHKTRHDEQKMKQEDQQGYMYRQYGNLGGQSEYKKTTEKHPQSSDHEAHTETKIERVDKKK